MFPAPDVGFVGIGDTCRASIKRNRTCQGEMKDVFMAVVDVSLGIDGLEMACADCFIIACLDRDRLDPVEGVLELEEIRRGQREK